MPNSIKVLVDDDQYQELLKAAKTAGFGERGLSTWIRFVALRAARDNPKMRAPKARLEADKTDRAGKS